MLKLYPSNQQNKRQRAYKHGIIAEYISCLLLLCSGYRILHRRWRCKYGEIDIIAYRGNTLAFIEVKARKHMPEALHAITAAQRNRLARAAHFYLGHAWGKTGQRDPSTLKVRFDAVLICPWQWPRHLKDAWRPEI